MNPNRRHLATRAAALAALALGGQRAVAQPSAAPIRLLVGASPGGSTDTIAREIAPETSRLLGRPVIVENRAGAGGNLAAEAVAKAAPDGSTLLVSFTSHAVNATLYPKLPFDPIADFTPLTLLGTAYSVLVAHPSVPVKDVRELIAYAKSRPGQLSFALGGIGSSLHLAGDMLKMQAGLYIVNIPYRGTTPAITDVIAGHVPLMVAPLGGVRAHVQAGRLKLLGVTSPKRLAQLPDVPAIAEVLPGYESAAWWGLFGPARMAPEVARPIADAARAAVATDAMRRRLEADGGQPVGNGSEEFARFVKTEIDRYAKVVRYAGATPE
ncbi:MAG: tripartite tricarboxylate transporter substrate binding protein [Burkholderiales bacterium]|jgi:tripartite-type tricarboxylate transporter receptor subunit TctC